MRMRRPRVGPSRMPCGVGAISPAKGERAWRLTHRHAGPSLDDPQPRMMPKGVWAVPVATAVARDHTFQPLAFQPGELLRLTEPNNLLSNFLGEVAVLLPGTAAPGNVLIFQGMDDPIGIVPDDPREGIIR